MSLSPILRVVFLSALAITLCTGVRTAEGQTAAVAGPENGGLRLRLTAAPREGAEGFEARLELLNVSQDMIRLQTAWESTEEGDVKDYLLAIAQVECVPPFAPEHGATGVRQARDTPQKTQDLPAGEALSLTWQTSDRRLQSDGPRLAEPGLYSVHVRLDVVTAGGPVRLRSNEQLVSVGGSLQAPQPSSGRIQSVASDGKSATFELGALDQVSAGDQFDITSKTAHWRLTITAANASFSEGSLQSLGSAGGDSPPTGGEWAVRVKKKPQSKSTSR